MKISIMQPYFLPYIGYWQLIYNADVFIIYDDIEYTKKGWINRNRYCDNEYFTVSIKAGSDKLNINERVLAESWNKDKAKILRKIKNFYRKYDMFDTVFPIVEYIFNVREQNLFEFIYNSLIYVGQYLEIDTPIVVTSDFESNNELKNKERVKALCKDICEDNIIYVNPIGGLKLYNYEDFRKDNIELRFLQSKVTETLSIIDLMFKYPVKDLQCMLTNYEELKDGCWAI